MTDWIETIESSWGANKRVYRIAGRTRPATRRAVHRLPSVPGFSAAALAAPVAEYYEFNTEEELHAIEVAARWARNTDFRRFFMDGIGLMVEFQSGMTAFSGLTVEPMPSKKEPP